SGGIGVKLGFNITFSKACLVRKTGSIPCFKGRGLSTCKLANELQWIAIVRYKFALLFSYRCGTP
ncbi:hypothetical protein, partial [Vibrio anguillarum]